MSVSSSLSNGELTWCCEVLRKLLGGIPRGSVILIVGTPGAGKTTIAAKTAYENLKLGHKVIYFGINETEGKFIKYMSALGMDFSRFVREGRFRFIELPLLNPEVGTDLVLETIAKEVGTFKPDLVVIDSVTPLIRLVSGGDVYSARAFMRSGLYKVFTELKSVLLLVADTPLGTELSTLGDLEFVADYLLIIKHELIRTSVRRCIEIVKARGVPIRLPRVYFKIVDGRGPVPYVLREVIAEEANKTLSMKVSKFRRLRSKFEVLKPLLGTLNPGAQILILYPPGSDANRAFTIAQAAIGVKLGLNTTVVTYSMDPLDLFKLSLATALGAGIVGSVEEGVKVFEKYLRVLGINLAVLDTELLQYCEVSEAYTTPETDLVIVPDMKALYDYLGSVSEFNKIQYTFANWDRTLGTVAIRYYPDVPEVKDLVLSEVSDVIIKLVPSTTTPKTILHYRMLLTKSYLSMVKEVPVSRIIELLKSVVGIEVPSTKVVAKYFEEVSEWLHSRGYVPKSVVRSWRA